jgi:endonuclease YncB( thermonuclease family)
MNYALFGGRLSNISNPDYDHELWNKLGEEYTGKLVSVNDGATLEILHKQHTDVSVSMVDCLENGQAYGKRAKQAASQLVFGKDDTLHPFGTDKYGRTLAVVLLPEGANAGQRRLVLAVSEVCAGGYGA